MCKRKSIFWKSYLHYKKFGKFNITRGMAFTKLVDWTEFNVGLCIVNLEIFYEIYKPDNKI